MFSLINREINSFLNSVIGYVVIAVFLITVSLFLWVFPDTTFNILDSGSAGLEGLFSISPWVFMFLIPAITMRLFAEEKKSGTIELLLTRPLTELQIVFSKYLAGQVLVMISLLPTLVFYYTVYELATPIGNVDTGSIWGSYIGLFFLSAGFVSIGLFASSVTDNQVVAFIIAMFLCFVCFLGFESISTLLPTGSLSSIIYAMGINAHYISMSRGVVDSRDLIYFLSLITLFIFLTRLVLESRKW